MNLHFDELGHALEGDAFGFEVAEREWLGRQSIAEQQKSI